MKADGREGQVDIKKEMETRGNLGALIPSF